MTILPNRIILTLLFAIASLPALAQSKLPAFTESRGCKLFGSEAVVKRLQEFAAQGTVIWDGPCKNGLIDGKGVLREEGIATIDGKAKKFAYFFTGSARKGLRQGMWRRESFERFADSAVFYTAASTLKFVDGVAKGSARLLAIHSLEQLTPAFRKLVIAAQSEARPANAALLADARQSVASPRPKENAAAGDAGPKMVYSFFPLVAASSQFEQFGPEGLLTFLRPGWHSATPPDFPEWLLVDFRSEREITMIGLLAQDDHQDRAPRIIRIESSTDGQTWLAQNAAEIPCAPNSDGGWLNLGLLTPARGRYLKIVVLANCGARDYVGLRGLRFK